MSPGAAQRCPAPCGRSASPSSPSASTPPTAPTVHGEGAGSRGPRQKNNGSQVARCGDAPEEIAAALGLASPILAQVFAHALEVLMA